MRCIIVTFNFPPHHIVFANTPGDRLEMARLFSSVISHLAICFPSAPPPQTTTPSPTYPSPVWKFNLRGKKFRNGKGIYSIRYKRLHFDVLQRDLVTRTPSASHQTLRASPFLVSNQLKELCISQTVNFQGKVCHLLLAAGRPGKCR